MTTHRPIPCPCRVDARGRRWVNAGCHRHGMPSCADEPLSNHDLRVIVDEATVDALAVQRSGMARNHPQNTPVRRAAVRHLTEAGKSTRQIAERLGVSQRTVTRHRQQGVTR